MEKHWVHFIGICGVTMAPLANMFKKMGWEVTGSDKGIFPPMSTYLKKRDIKIELGFKKDHLRGNYYDLKSSYPEFVIVGNYAGLKNVEYKFALENKLKVRSFPEILEEYLIKENSIVVAGTYGKTTSSGLLSLIFKEAGLNPSFMIGGLTKNFEDSIENSKSDWSIVEGDEYISARFDEVSKFFHYKPEFLMLTACAWEHTDFFKTEEQYIENFKKLMISIPKNGIIVANKIGENVAEVLKEARCKIVTYELNKLDNRLPKADWFNIPHKENPDIGEIVMFNRHTREEFQLETQLIGSHNKENIIGCAALARELDIEIESVIKAVEDYKGIKRRLEIRYEEENLKVLDDHACSPPKVKGSLKALNETYNDWHKTIVFEPNVGNRTEESLKLFKNTFKYANEIIIPHLKIVKTKTGEKRVDGKTLADYLQENGENVRYIEKDNELVDYISKKNVGKHIICFMGSYGWRRMIKEVIEKIQ